MTVFITEKYVLVSYTWAHTKPCTLDHGCAQMHALYNTLLLCKLQDVVRERAHFSPVSILGRGFTVIKSILDMYHALFLPSPNQQSCCWPGAESPQLSSHMSPFCFTALGNRCSDSEHRDTVLGFQTLLNWHLKILCSESEHRKFYVRNPNKAFVIWTWKLKMLLEGWTSHAAA
jgi:hypothetical protein